MAQNRQGVLYLFRQRVFDAAKIRERQQRDARLDIEAPHFTGREHGDLGQVFRRRLNVDGRIGDKIHTFFKHHRIQTGNLGNALAQLDDLQRRTQCLRIMPGETGDHAVRFTEINHHRPEIMPLFHCLFGIAAGRTFALAQFIKLFDIMRQFRRSERIDNLNTAMQGHLHFFNTAVDDLLIAQQDRMRHALVENNLASLQNCRQIAFGINDALGLRLGLVDHHAHKFAADAETAFQLLAIFVEIEGLLRHAAVHRRFRHRRRHPQEHARIERLGNNVVAAKLEALQAIGFDDRIRHWLFGEISQRAGGGMLHLFVDRGRPHIERAAKDERKAEHVVDLIRIIRAAGGHHQVAAHGSRVLESNFRIRICHRENNGIFRHRLDHGFGEDIRPGKTDQHIGAFNRFGQGARFRLRRELGFVGIHVFFAAGIHHAFGVTQNQIAPLDAETEVIVGAGNS
ncbi:MAG: hypothetical protein ALAOOOJD_02279 [bacterium]|nr:hypothetical protein [bacterium]